MASNYTRVISSIVFNSPSPPTTLVDSTSETVYYKGTPFSLPNLRIGFTTSIEKVKEMMESLCRGCQNDWDYPENAYDDWGESKRSFGILSIGKWTYTEGPLLNKLRKIYPDLLKIVDGQVVLNRGIVMDVMDEATAIRNLLGLLIFFLAGQQCRLAEFLDHKFANSIRDRTIFLGADYRLYFVVRRAKYENKTRKEIFIPTVLPPVLTQLFLSYLLVIRPLEIEFAAFLYNATTAKLYSEFLFVVKGKRMKSCNFSQVIRNWFHSTQSSRYDVGCHKTRQALEEFTRLYLGNEYFAQLEHEGGDIIAQQQIHSQKRARESYGIEAGHLPSLTSDYLDRVFIVCEQWWQMWGLREGFPPLLPLKQRIRARQAPLPSLDSLSGSFDTATLIPIIQNAVQESVQAALADFSVFKHQLKVEIRDIVKDTVAQVVTQQSMQSNNSLTLSELPSLSEPFAISPSDPPLPVFAPAPPFEPVPLEELPLHLETILSRLPGRTAFRSKEQEEMVRIALKAEENALIVLPTGGGKSMAWLLAGKTMDTSASIVMIPNKSLLEDQVQEAERFDIPVEIFKAGKTTMKADTKLVFTALESITSPTFQT